MPKDYSLIPEAKWAKMHRSFLHSTGIRRRAEVMYLFKETLRCVGLKNWLAMSALLGIHREGKLLERDEDVDFFCYSENLIENFPKVRAAVLAAGFDVRGYSHKGRLTAFMDGEAIALLGHRKKGKYRWFKNRRVPEKFFSHDACVMYEGALYRCMWPIEDYLRWQYKNWKKPYYGNPENRDKYMNKRKVKK